MLHAITFDTLSYAKRLMAADVPQKQAEAQAEIFAELIEDQIATKADLNIIRRDLKEMEMRITIRLGTMMAFSITIVAVLVKLL